MKTRRTKKQIELDKEFTCTKCKLSIDVSWKFTPYGNELRKQEAILNKSYCSECFKKREEQLW